MVVKPWSKRDRTHARILSRLGLMPLTPSSTIARRYGLTASSIEEKRNLDPRSNVVQREVIERLRVRPAADSRMSDPRNLLQHPKLWAIHRTIELAPSYSAPRIHQTLVAERAALPGNLKNNPIPSVRSIQLIISRFASLDPERKKKIRAGGKARRPPNALRPGQRERLKIWARQFFHERYSRGGIRGGQNFTREEMLSWMIEVAENDATFYGKLSKSMAQSEMKKRWIGYLRMASKYYWLNAAKKVRRKEKGVLDEDVSSKREPIESEDLLESIRFRPALNENQRIVWDLRAQGKSRKEIALILGLTRAAITKRLNEIRQRMVA